MTRWLAHGSFWLATAAMGVMGWTLFVAADAEIGSAEMVSHAREVRQSVAEVDELAGRAETAHRAFLVSGDPGFLSRRDEAFDKLNESVAQVRQLTEGSRSQQLRVSQLEKLIAMRIAILQHSGRSRRAVGPEAAAKIQDLTTELRREELRLQKENRDDADKRHDAETRVLLAGVGFGLLVLIPGYLGFIFQTRARRRSEEMLRVMADSLPGALYQLRHDAKGEPRFTFMSAGVQRVCDISATDSSGALPDWTAMVKDIEEQDRPPFMSALAASMKSLTAFRHSYRAKHGEADVRCLHHEASLLRQDDGTILQNGYIADNTEQKRLEEALQDAKSAADAANRAKSTFLATMSHEIRTPMNGVLGMLEILSLTPLDTEQRSTLGMVRESGHSLLRIIDDILDFSKIEAGKLEVRPEATSIRDVIEGAYNIYSGTASSKGVLFTRAVDPQISEALLADPLRLRQILNNFVSNAVKFTPRGGSVAMSAELLDREGGEDRIRFSVKDTGVGVSLANQARLFQPFSQIDDRAAGRAGGTGLGLIICRRLASMMGGSVEMLSDPGVGTTVTLSLSLPIADPKDLPRMNAKTSQDLAIASAKARRLAPTINQAEAEGTLVLVVDDHPTNRILLLRQVQTLGYAGESAKDGVEALNLWRSGRFAIVVTDCNMPEMDGYELARSIRRLEAGTKGRTPIIACTANALGGEAEICFAAGMDDYLPKPVELSQMLAKLDQWLPIPVSHAGTPVQPAPEILPTSEASEKAGAPLDPAILAAVSGGDAATEREILTGFRRANDDDAMSLRQAVDKSDTPQVARAAHRMLGASRMVGAPAFATVCERIEHASRHEDWATIAASMTPFQREWDRLNTYLDAVCSRRSGE